MFKTECFAIMQALRNIYCAIAAIAIKHMCALSELNVLDFISQVKTLLMKNKQTKVFDSL